MLLRCEQVQRQRQRQTRQQRWKSAEVEEMREVHMCIREDVKL
jgi:hypothetical protein